MPRQVECKHLCALSADEFWSLRCDLGFDKYLAAIEKQNAEWQLNDEFRDAQGNRQLRRIAKLIYKENPVPKSVLVRVRVRVS